MGETLRVSGLEKQLLLLQDHVTGSAIFTENGSKIMGHGASLVNESCECS